MRYLFRSLPFLLSCLGLLSWCAQAEAAARFASAPHFLTLEGREQIVLFVEGEVGGAMVRTRADGTAEIVVPSSGYDAAFDGQVFDDEGAGGAAGARLVFQPEGERDTRLLVRTKQPVERISAFSKKNPSRLVIELVSKGAAPAPAEGKRTREKAKGKKKSTRAKGPTPKPVEEKPSAPVETAIGKPAEKPARPIAKQSAAPVDEKKASAIAKAPLEAAEAASAVAEEPFMVSAPVADGEPVGLAQAAPEQAPPPATVLADTKALAERHAPTETRSEEPVASEVGAAVVPEGASAERDARPGKDDEGLRAELERSRLLREAGVEVLAAARRTAQAPDEPGEEEADEGPAGLPGEDATAAMERMSLPKVEEPLAAEPDSWCQWRRIAGVPFCAPDPFSAPYQHPPAATHLAHRLARAARSPIPLPGGLSGVALYLTADREFAVRAKSGWLRPAADFYVRALRVHPQFADRRRAEVNLSFVYAFLDFEPELRRLSQEGGEMEALRRGLLVEYWLDRGEMQIAADVAATIPEAVGLSGCVAHRALAGLAVREGRYDEADRYLQAVYGSCSTAFVEDVRTRWVATNLSLKEGKRPATLRRLRALIDAMPPQRRGALMGYVGRQAEEVGEAAVALELYTELATERFGRTLAHVGLVGLARLNATSAPIDGDDGLAGLPPALRAEARKDVAERAATAALEAGQGARALALLQKGKLAADEFGGSHQLRIARAYEDAGLTKAARDHLERLRHQGGELLGAPFFAADVRVALAEGNLRRAGLALAEFERRREGAEALELRARVALAASQLDRADGLLSELVEQDPVRAQDLQIDLARRLEAKMPSRAMGVAQDVLSRADVAPLTPEKEARVLRIFAEAAEGAGEVEKAGRAFGELAARFGDLPAARAAGYRAARLSNAEEQGDPARGADPVTRKMATAAEMHRRVLQGFARREER